MHFLLQIYCPLENKKHAYHRTLYLFFCIKCWTRSNAIKVLRLQLNEKSDYYINDKLINRNEIENDKSINLISSKIKSLKTEYFINTKDEHEEATHIYTNFYDKLDEKSLKSINLNNNSDDDENIEEEIEEDIQNIKNDPNIDKMIKQYYKDEGETDDVYYNN